MKIIGIEIKHPAPTQLLFIALILSILAAVLSLMVDAGSLDAKSAWLFLTGVATGIITASFGISPIKHGLKGVVLMFAITNILFLLLYVLPSCLGAGFR